MQKFVLEIMGRPLQMKKKMGRIGFKDFKGFNLALLAKQCWRIINTLPSKVVKCLRAKYFSLVQFLHASLGCKILFYCKASLKGEIFSL